MKPFILSALATGLLVGCASTDTTTVTRRSGSVADQPQTAITGEGSLMPGAYDTSRLPTGQFTGRERTNDQIGQRPTLPGEADARDFARSEESLGTSGTGALGQSGIVPNSPITAETLLENADEGIGSAPGISTGSSSSTNNAPANSVTNSPPLENLTNAPASSKLIQEPAQPD